jgi:hypothetical protein
MKTRCNHRHLLCVLAFITVPRLSPALPAHVVLNQTGTNFSYTLFNDAPASSQEYLNVFHLNPTGPFQVGPTPLGWSFVTDYLSYIDWFCVNPLSANPNDVAPGSSLAGFSITSLTDTTISSTYALTSWYRGLTNNGSLAEGAISAPSLLTSYATLSNPAHLPTDTFQLTVQGIPGFAYTVQASSNLLTWTELHTNLAPFTFLDTNAVLFSERFYRAASSFDFSTISGD